MKRILLAGSSNVDRFFEKVMQEQEDPSIYRITVCEINDGDDIYVFDIEELKEQIVKHLNH